MTSMAITFVFIVGVAVGALGSYIVIRTFYDLI